MNLHCRGLLAACLVLAGCLAAPARAAPAWPTRAVRMIVPSAPGAAPDIMARVIGDKLARIWGQPVIVENRNGAGGLVGLGAAKTAERDDHLFVFAPASVLTLTPYMYKSSQVDIVHDFAPVAMVGLSPMIAAVSADSPARTLADVLAIARRQPDKFVVSTTFLYSVPNLAVDMLSRASGVPLRAVPFSTSGQSIAAVVAGDTQLLIDGVPPVDPMVRSGRLRAVALFSEERVADRPDLPTAAETYPSLVINGWFGVVAPAGTSAAAIQRVNHDMAAVLADREVIDRLAGLGVYPKTLSPGQFGTYWKQELTRWEQVLRDVNAQPVQQ